MGQDKVYTEKANITKVLRTEVMSCDENWRPVTFHCPAIGKCRKHNEKRVRQEEGVIDITSRPVRMFG